LEKDLIFYLEEQITEVEEEDKKEMVKFRLYEKNITNIIKSRNDLIVDGVDRINYQIMKRTKMEKMKFMKLLVRKCIQSKRIISTSKEAKMILLHKKKIEKNFGIGY
jgi:hypothetical protein